MQTGPYDDYGYAFRLDGNWSPNDPGPPFNTYWPVTGNFSFGITAGEGGHSLRVVLYKFNWGSYLWDAVSYSEVSFTFVQNHRITIENSFGGGSVKVDGATFPSGSSFTWAKGTTHTLEAIDGQSSGGYIQRFDNWSGPGAGSGPVITISVNDNSTYRANFKKEFNIVFQNNYPGYGNGGIINVNGTQYSSPTSSFPVRQDNSITGGVVNTYQVINGIEYTFSSWSPGGSTSASTQFTPTDHTTYTANFNARPLPPPNVSAGGPVGSYVQLSWNEHPHSSVSQYQIWRKVKPPGQQEGPPQLLTTVNRGITSFTDFEYIVTDGYTHALLWYDVRAYFSVNGSYSDPNWVSAFGRQDNRLSDNVKQPSSINESVPTEYSLSTYPNPFNPTTTLRYQLAEDAFVTLTIADVLGRVITTLVQTEESAGSHAVQWNGRDARDKPVASGVYLYRFTAIPLSGKQPVSFSGKLLLSK